MKLKIIMCYVLILLNIKNYLILTTMASRPRLTKTEALRQARTAALMKEYERKQETKTQPESVIDPGRRRRYIPAEAKKVEFTRPAMTKAMMARVKQAEKFKQEYERKREETMPMRRMPRRTPAPIGGDPR